MSAWRDLLRQADRLEIEAADLRHEAEVTRCLDRDSGGAQCSGDRLEAHNHFVADEDMP